jgi:glycosyltransferase involved in cell wall biosynthesis
MRIVHCERPPDRGPCGPFRRTQFPAADFRLFQSAFVAPRRTLTKKSALNSPDISSRVESLGRITYGLDLALDQETGIAAETRLLTHIAGTLGYDVGVFYSTAFTPDEDPLLQEVLFFDQMRAPHKLGKKPTLRRRLNTIIDQIRYNFTVKPLPLQLDDAVIYRQYAEFLGTHSRVFIDRNLFDNANLHFRYTGKFVNMSFDPAPDIFHCTFQTPLRVQSARNIYTINDLIPRRILSSAFENKKSTFRLLKRIADTADHIVTVSEKSKRDIVRVLKVGESRVSNLYTAVALPQKYIDRSEEAVADYLEGRYRLAMYGYLLVFGGSESTRNLDQLIEACRSSGVEIPLVLATARGWRNADEFDRLSEHIARERARNSAGSRLRCLNDISLSSLVSLIRGARAVVFPSLHDDLGLPVLESMMLGRPVIASTGGALSEISGEAALRVNPCDVDDMACAIRAIVNDADLRRELSRRGAAQAAKFSVARYRERVRSLYAALA